MTIDQREKITELRNIGKGYAYIAETVGLSKSTVASFCQRHMKTNGHQKIAQSQPNLKKSEIQRTPGVCMNCGKSIASIIGHRERKYCSDACRMLWWGLHKENMNMKSARHYTCASCGKEFTAYGRKERKYCSHECYISGRFGQQDSGGQIPG